MLQIPIVNLLLRSVSLKVKSVFLAGTTECGHMALIHNTGSSSHPCLHLIVGIHDAHLEGRVNHFEEGACTHLWKHASCRHRLTSRSLPLLRIESWGDWIHNTSLNVTHLPLRLPKFLKVILSGRQHNFAWAIIRVLGKVYVDPSNRMLI